MKIRVDSHSTTNEVGGNRFVLNENYVSIIVSMLPNSTDLKSPLIPICQENAKNYVEL